MFGRHNDQQTPVNDNNSNDNHDTLAAVEAVEPEHAGETVTPNVEHDTNTNTPSNDDSQDWQHPGNPIVNDPEPIDDIRAGDGPASQADGQPPLPPRQTSPPRANDDDSGGSQDLVDIKQKALSQLSPLVSHLDQTPEEKFRTLMMMIQGSDDQSLIKDAYEAAQAISDEKARAQALLDIVNEINYFTSHQEN